MYGVNKQKSDHGDARSVLPLTLSLDLGLDGLTDGQLTGPLADLCQVSSGETVCDARQVFQVHILQEGERGEAKGKRKRLKLRCCENIEYKDSHYLVSLSENWGYP